MFIVTLCMIGKIWKQPKHLSTEQQNVVYTHTHTHTHIFITEYYSATKRRKPCHLQQ